MKRRDKLLATDIVSLKSAATRAFRAAVRRADPGVALMDCIRANGLPRPRGNGKTYVIALGKAAPAMMRALQPELTGPRSLICVTHRENAEQVAGAEVFRAGHPVPDDVGAHAARRVQEILAATTDQDVVLALVSGGGSALLPAPPPGVSLDDKQALNRLLLASGLEINAVNAIRQHVSMLKGGGLLRAAAPAPVTAYILSDVIGDDLRAIASGPTVAPIASRAEVMTLLASKGLDKKLPASILAHLQTMPRNAPLPQVTNHLIGGNSQSTAAAAKILNNTFSVTGVDTPLVGDVGDAARTIVSTLRANAGGETPQAVVWGGETTVQLQGSGLGGRNQELALRVAALLDASPINRPWVFLSAGTDGRDGPTEAAGAIVDQETLPRIRAEGGDPKALLAQNDSNAALALAEDLLVTGATGTNVADVQVLLIG